MRYLRDTEEEEGIKWMNEAARVAQKAICLKAKCGTVIVKDGKIIGEGYNAPPLDDIEHRKCLETQPSIDKPKSDRTCCMHAEWRAILDAIKKHPEQVQSSQLFFIRIDDDGNIKKSGQPYCTVCSRLALDTGISVFHLWHDEGIASYPTDEYNDLSYKYTSPQI